MQGFINGTDLLATGKISFDEIVDLLKKGLINIFDNNGKKLDVYIDSFDYYDDTDIDWEAYKYLKSYYKNDESKLNNNLWKCWKHIKGDSLSKVGDFERFTIEECKLCKFDNFDIQYMLETLNDMCEAEHTQLNRDIEESWKYNYQMLIHFFLQDAKINIDRDTVGKIYKQIQTTKYKLCKDFIRGVLQETDMPGICAKKKINESSYLNVMGFFYEKWRKERINLNIIDQLKSEMDKYNFSMKKKDLQNIINKLEERINR